MRSVANAFMPSVASSLNAGGQDALEQIMKQRLFQQQMQQAQLQGQGQLNDFRLQGRQLDAQERYRQDVIAQNDRDNAARLEAVRLKLAADGQDAKVYQQAAERATAAYKAGDMDTVRLLVSQFKLPVSMFAEQKKEETPGERSRRIIQDEVDHATGKAKGLEMNPSLRPTKVAKEPKDSAEIPARVKQTLMAMRGMWPDAKTAIREVTGKHWQQLRGQNPDLSLSKVSTYIQDMYGQNVTPTEVRGGSSGGDMSARVRAVVLEKMRQRALTGK